MLQAVNHLCAFSPECPGETMTGPSTTDVTSPALNDGERSHPDLLVPLIPTQPRRLLAFPAVVAHCWLMFGVHQDLNCFCKAAIQPVRAYASAQDLSFHGAELCTSLLLNFLRFLFPCFSSEQPHSHLVSLQACVVCTAPETALSPSIQVTKAVLNSIGYSTGPWVHC